MLQEFYYMLYLRVFFILLLGSTANLSMANSTEQLEKKLTELQGQVVYLDFWASWCGPCRKSFPWMNEMQTKYKAQGFTIVSVNVDSEKELADKFLSNNPANFTVIYDPKGKIARQFKLKGMPSSYLINKEGKIVSAHVGFVEKKKPIYEQAIKQLIQQ